MESIPLCPRQVIAISQEDCALRQSAPEALLGALADSPETFTHMLACGNGLPVGIALQCPPFPEKRDKPVTACYIAQCKQVFRTQMHDKAAFYYLIGVKNFRALRAAVLALTDMTGRTLVAELHTAEESRMEDGTDCLAAVGVLQRIGVSTVILRADEAVHLEDTLTRIAPHARLSLGVRVPSAWLHAHVTLTNTEIALPVPQESAAELWAALSAYAGCRAVRRDHDDMILAPDGRDAHFIHAVTDISDEIPCDHRLEQRLLDIEDEEAAALKLVLKEEDDLYNLETALYMLSRPVCLCAETPELLEKALRVYHGLAIDDGTCARDALISRYFSEKYGMICL